MPTDEAMLQEAISAARSGDKVRSRDLLARLLQIDRDHPEHWLWMSAVVETRQEQVYCLQNLRRLDPDNVIARRGLILMGELEPEAKEVQPVPPQRKIPWTVTELELSRPTGWQALRNHPVARAVFYIAATALTIGLIAAGIRGFNVARPPTPTPDFQATSLAVGVVITLTPTNTASPTETPLFVTTTPTPSRPTPLALLLEATYTPTPRYVDTPHPQTEAFRLGIVALNRQNWEGMADFMQQTIDLEPDSADAYYYLGLALMEMGEFSRALEAFTTASQMDNLFGPAYLGRALARLALDPDTDVSRDFQNAVTRSSDFGLVYIERARYLIARDQHAEAESDLNTADALLAGSPEVPYLRALSAYLQGDYDTARAQAEEALARDQTALRNYRLLGEIEYAAENPAAAAEWLTTYVRYAPDDVDMLNLLAQALAQSGQLEQALGIFDQLLEDKAFNADVLLGRGLAYLASGDPDAALADLNRANRLRRNDFDIMLALGRALIEADDPGDAYIQFNQTLTLASTDAQQALLYYYRGLALSMLVERGDNSSRPAALRDLRNAENLSDQLPEELAAQIPSLIAALDFPPATQAAP